MELNELLNRTADHIVADGTQAESLALQAMASAARDLNQGAAAALVDWNGAEIARLRAFGIVHGVLLRELPDTAQAELLVYLLDISSAAALKSETPFGSQRRRDASATLSVVSTGAGSYG